MEGITMRNHRRHRLLLAAALVSLVFALAACATSGAAPAALSQNDNGAAAGATAAPEPGTGRDLVGAPGGNNSDGGQPLAAPVERQIIKTGEITIEVSNVANALGRVRAMALDGRGQRLAAVRVVVPRRSNQVTPGPGLRGSRGACRRAVVILR
jgi:hypothetical protein